MRRGTVLVSFALLLALSAGPAPADKGDIVVRFGAQFSSPTGDLSETEGLDTMKLEADSTTGGGVSVEYMASDLIGINTGIGFADTDVDATLTAPGQPTQSATLGTSTMMPLTVAANFHVARSEKFDFYLGPEVGVVFYSDLDFNLPDEADMRLEDDMAYGANMGLDVPFSERWAFCTNVKFLKTAADPKDDSGELDIDPWMVGVGFGVTF